MSQKCAISSNKSPQSTPTTGCLTTQNCAFGGEEQLCDVNVLKRRDCIKKVYLYNTDTVRLTDNIADNEEFQF